MTEWTELMSGLISSSTTSALMSRDETTVTEMDRELLSSRLFDVPVSLVVLLSIAYGAVSLAAVIGNSAVLWIVFRSHRLRTVTNVFIANLAIADILIGALAIPFQFVSALLQRWILPHFMCPFCAVVQIVSVNVSIFTLAAIAAERYLIVSHLLDCRITRQGAKFIILIIWTFALIFASPAGVALRVTLVPNMDSKALESLMRQQDSPANLSLPLKFQCENRGLDPMLWKWYNRLLVLIQYIVPVCVLLFAYGKMGLLLRGPSSPPATNTSDKYRLSDRSPSPNETSVRDRCASEMELSIQSNPRPAAVDVVGSRKADVTGVSLAANSEYIAANKRRVMKTLIIVVALFALCWLPLQSYTLLQDFFPHINEYRYINVIWFVCHFLAMSNSCLNPFVYAIYTLPF